MPDRCLQAIAVIGRLRQELDGLQGSPFLCSLQRANDLEQLPVTRLQQLRAQLHHDLHTLDKVTRWYIYLCRRTAAVMLRSDCMRDDMKNCEQIWMKFIVGNLMEILDVVEDGSD